jgi:hypothetical protein
MVFFWLRTISKSVASTLFPISPTILDVSPFNRCSTAAAPKRLANSLSNAEGEPPLCR